MYYVFENLGITALFDKGMLAGLRYKVMEGKEIKNRSEGHTFWKGPLTTKHAFAPHCLGCRKFFNHRHTPPIFNSPCDRCACKYFYGWKQLLKKWRKENKAGTNGPKTPQNGPQGTPLIDNTPENEYSQPI